MAANLRGDIAAVDGLLEAWARWGRSGLDGVGWPKVTLLGRVMHQGFTGAAQGRASKLEIDEACERTERAVLRLQEIERRVLVQHYVYWQPVEINAKACHMTAGRFRAVLHRARRRVADLLAGVAS